MSLLALFAMAALLGGVAVVVALLGPSLVRVVRAWLRLRRYRADLARCSRTSSSKPLQPLPAQLSASTLEGLQRGALLEQLGPPSSSIKLQAGTIASVWNHFEPRLTCYFESETCTKAVLDPDWHKRPTDPESLLARFNAAEDMLHKSLPEIEGIAGTVDDVCSFDHGVGVGEWRCGNVLIKAWLKSGYCTGIESYRDGVLIRAVTQNSGHA